MILFHHIQVTEQGPQKDQLGTSNDIQDRFNCKEGKEFNQSRVLKGLLTKRFQSLWSFLY